MSPSAEKAEPPAALRILYGAHEVQLFEAVRYRPSHARLCLMAASSRSGRSLRFLLGALVLGTILFLLLPEYLVELLWMQALEAEQVFWKILGTKALLFVSAFVVVGAYFAGNFYYLVRQLPPLWASKWAREGEAPQFGNRPLTRERLRTVGYVLAGLLGLTFAGSYAAQWDSFLRFASGQSYGAADPVFGQDFAFYMLQLPFIQTLQGTIVAIAFLALLIMVTAYVLMGEIDAQDGRVRVRPSVVRHLGLNLVLLLVGWGWGYFLDRYELLLSPGTAVFGAGYTDVNVVVPALWVMVAATGGLIALVVYNLYRYRFRWLAYGAGAYAVLFVVGLVVVPAVVQQVSVVPNELSVEEPYIEHNIRLTREAYQLDRVQERSYPAETDLTMEQVQANEATIRNIRLWDPRLLLDTYKQIQEIRSYYEFYNVDIDRYEIDGEYRQVMLSARELSQELPGQSNSWLNRHLQYTHGYGSVLNLVAQQGAEGVPNLLLKDLPPVTDYERFRVDQPALYYAEGVPYYRIVNTRARELHYPKGDENVYTSYDGTGGVLIGGFWRQLLFAWHQSDYNIVLSDYLQDGSRIQFWNRVQERVNKIAPFLKLDGDPYLVLSGQRQYWVQDAYTTARSFPYSEPVREVGAYRGDSYMRNSVKVVVDAYNGDVDFYVMDEEDPVLNTYRGVFPDLFQPLSALPASLKEHLRYPEDLFTVQVSKYRRYHMTIPQVFYNNEDLWTRPQEQYGGEEITMEPYYILMRLPDEDRLEFMLMTPYTPENRDNMIGWMAARSDYPDYGEIIVYKLPKEKLIYGPNQVEARIDQNTEISQQLTLWDQQGSNVIRGNLMVVPIEESFLYVEPVYLIAQSLQIPQLRRVIVAHGDRVAMQPTLAGALSDVLGMQVAGLQEESPDQVATPAGPPARQGTPQELRTARQALERAQEALRDGDFATFGEEFEALQEALREQEATPDTAAVTPPQVPAGVDTRR